MLKAIDAFELSEDKRFASNVDRMQHRQELIQALETVFVTRTTNSWVQLLNNAGIPASPVLDVMQMHEDEQTLAREMVTEVEHPVAGSVKTLGAPVKFHGTPGGVNQAAPLLGQHSIEVLKEIGYSSDEIESMLEKRVIASR